MVKRKPKAELKRKEFDLLSLLNDPTILLDKLDSTKQKCINNSLKFSYDSLKNVEMKPTTGNKLLLNSTLPELIVEKFDDEQIWQQIDLQNNEKIRSIKRQIDKIDDFDGIFRSINLANTKKSVENFDEDNDDEIDDDENDDDENDDDENDDDEKDDDLDDPNEFFDEKNGENENDDDDDSMLSDEINEEIENSQRENNENERENNEDNVDDKFFRIRDMEAFLEAEDRKEQRKLDGVVDEDDESDVDFFANDDGDEPELDGRKCRYKQFFDQPNFVGDVKKKVKFSDDVAEEDENEAEEGEMPVEDDQAPTSSFEARQKNLRKKIGEIENELISEKPWQEIGEISAKRRPENSLLQEHLLFEHATRLPPVITQETTVSLEDIIKQRIKDKAWDDVERKAKPTQEHFKYKNDLILDQQKSKLSLSQVYEKEYLKQTQKEIEEAKNPQHDEIRRLMKNLFVKLDALTNYHYTPKLMAPEIKIVSNMKSIVMEEVAPVTVSEADLLAPEEIKRKSRGEIKSSEERSKTDKNRDRKRHKLITKLKEKKNEEKEKRSKKVPKNKMKLLEKVGKVQKVKVDKNSLGGRGKNASSQQFFAKFQSQTSSGFPKKRQKIDSSLRSVKL